MPRVVKPKTVPAKTVVVKKTNNDVNTVPPKQAPVVKAVVEAATAAAAPVVSDVGGDANEVVSEVERKMEQRLQDMIEELKDYKAMVNGMCNNFIEQLTDAKREIKQLKRTQKKPRPTNINAPKKPFVFGVPTGLSDQMCEFLGLPAGTQMTRNDVTHQIHLYCKQHNLLADGDRRIINPDAKMETILSPRANGEQLTYLNLQHYIKHNYPK